MKKYKLKPPRRRITTTYTTQSVSKCPYTNLIENTKPKRPGEIVVSDLTYIKYKGSFIYLATVEDIFTREILSADISVHHDSELALSVVKEALKKLPHSPQLFHSDQGSEFMAQMVTDYIEKQGVKISVSDKASPWQNGYKESFFSRLKVEMGDMNRFETLGELIEEIYSYINYHNTKRIHTALKMTPLQFKNQFQDRDFVFEKRGT